MSESSEFPKSNGVRYERVDSLTVNVYVDGPSDSIRPPSPARQKIRERDREINAAYVAKFHWEQEKRKRRKPSNDPDS